VKVPNFKLVRVMAHRLSFPEVWGTEHVLQ